MSTGSCNNVVGIGVTIYRTIFQLQFTSKSPVFTRQNTFEKKRLGEVLIEQIIEFELRGPGPYSRTCILLQQVIFMTKQQS